MSDWEAEGFGLLPRLTSGRSIRLRGSQSSTTGPLTTTATKIVSILGPATGNMEQ